MAYNTIIQFEYKDINEVDTIVRVKQLDYAGAVTTRDYVSAGAKFAWGDSSNNVPVIYGSQCTVYVDSESDYEFLYLFSSNARKHLVEVTKGGQLFWIGFIEPDSWSEPLVTAPYPVEFTAYDGLGMLDNIDFVDANGDTYTGTMTMIALIQQLLGNIGIVLTLNTATDFKEEQQAVGTDYFEVHKVNLEAFEGMTCLEVLEQLLEGHRIQQRNGEWWITSYTLIPAGGSITYRTYADGSDVSSGTSVQSIENTSDWWSEGEMAMNMLPALRNITIDQDYRYQKNILKGGSFTNDWQNYWSQLSTNASIKPLDDSGNVFVYLQGISSPANDGIVHIGQKLDTGNGAVKFSVKYGLVSNDGKQAGMYWNAKFVTASNDVYYLRQRIDTVNEELVYEWELFGSIVRYVSFRGVYGSFPQYVTGKILDEIGSNLSSYEQIIPQVPTSGTLYISLLEPVSSDNGILGAAYADASLELMINEDDSYEGSNAITVINNQNNNNVPDNISLVIGVVPQIANNEVIYKGGILRADGTQAAGFAAGASAFYSWAELIGRVNASTQRNPRRAYEGTFADIIPRMNMVVTDANNSNLRLIETGITYDDGMQTVQGQYVEVLSLSLVAGQEGDYVVQNAISTGSSGSSGGAGGSGSGAATSTANWDTLLNRPDWTNYFDYDPVNDEVLLSKTLRITGSLLATASVVAWVASAVSSDVLANLTANAPLYKPTNSSVGLKYNTTQFEVNASSELQIQSGVLAPAAHTHQISDITGLQTALDGKESLIPAGTTAQYWRGDKTWQTLNTTAVTEGTNLYYTNARVSSYLSGAISTVLTANLTANRALISNASGKVAVSSVTSTELGYLSGVTSAIQTQLNTKINSSLIGAANGVAPLDASGKVAETYLPDSILGQVEYQGTWNPATNTPALPTASTVKGHYYIASSDGTYNTVEYKTGDWVISDGTSWTKVDNTDAVSTVFGRVGPILAVEADYQAYYPRLSQAYANPSWISSLAYSKITGVPDFLLSSSYTAADVLAKIKTVDGSGSGLDADLLDGLNSTSFWQKTEAGSTAYAWSASNLTLNGSITGATSITASGNINTTGGGFQTSGTTRISSTGAANFTSITGNGLTGLYNYVGTGLPTYSTSNITVYDSAPYAEGVGGAITFTGKYNAAGTYLGGAPFIRAHKMNATDGDYGYGLAFGTRIYGGAQKISALLSDTYLTVYGNILATGEITAYSDRRLKSNIQVITNPAAKISQISGYTYTKDGKRSAGVIAQEIRNVLPEAVSGTESPTSYLSVNDAAITGLLIEAIKEQQTEIRQLRTEINNLRRN